ncbi:hypothetical protein NGH30_07310 [Macrococcus caseolyticus]|uniref:hypothetical protein n=1 Tax=Macrococcoides caseolyticum TaxID=69966 RepID=UPI002DBF5367|nr:hypothetical protein [Macrococcus caseolyticus]MEB8171642.1 hypothetical protein [Macrococcus caseolyticus]
MKIFKQNILSEEVIDSKISYLIDNPFNLDTKMDNLKESYADLKLSPDGINRLVEFIFNKLNINIRFSRIGDNAERFDAILKLDDKIGLIEIQVPSEYLLDTPRNLLDNLAVSISRRNYKKNDIIPIVICWTYPNKRTDYWKVIDDIYKVLGIKIYTISILSLALMYWKGKNFSINDQFFLHGDKTELKELKELLIDCKIDLNKYPGFFGNVK